MVVREVKKIRLLVALVGVMVSAGCGSGEDLETVVTLSRVASPSGRFHAVFQQIDTHGGATVGFVYEVRIAGAAAPVDGEVVVELRHLDWGAAAPFELEWEGDSKLTIRFKAADTHRHEEFVEVADGEGKTQRIEVVLEPGTEPPAGRGGEVASRDLAGWKV